MKKAYVFKTFSLCMGAFLLVYAGFIATHHSNNSNEEISKKSSNNKHFSNYLLKTSQKTKKSHYTRVEIAVKDDLKIPDGKITEVKVNGDKLTLRPTDPSGNRGSTFLKTKPGKLQIKWYVKKNKYAYPRKEKYYKEIMIPKDTYWMHIMIEGKNISIN